MTPYVQVSRLLKLAAGASTTIAIDDGMPLRDATMWYSGKLRAAGTMSLQPVLLVGDPSNTPTEINQGAATALTAASAAAGKVFQQTVGEIIPGANGLKKHASDDSSPLALRYGLKVSNTGANEEQMGIFMVAVAAPTGG